MYKSNYLVLLVVALMCLFSSIEAGKIKTWKFYNWNRYNGKATVGKGSNWDKAWGIPEHGGWLWFWKNADKLKSIAYKSGKKDYVIRVKYPKGSRNPEANPIGGLGFKAEPLEIDNKVKTVEFQYSVYFPKGFNFVRGGKLPGLYGGHGDCTGGIDSNKCFTTRVMWRDNGEGEVYAYLPSSKQRSNLCDSKVNICNPDYGYSLGRGTFKFKTGNWVTVRQVLTINTVDKQNGKLSLYINGKRAMTQTKLVFRTNSTGRVAGIMFHTFFGGSDKTWKTPKTQYSYFKNFSLKTIS